MAFSIFRGKKVPNQFPTNKLSILREGNLTRKSIFPTYSLILSIFQIHCYSTIFLCRFYILFKSKKIVLYFFDQTGPISLFFEPWRAGIVLYLKIAVLYFLAKNRAAFSILSFSIKKNLYQIFGFLDFWNNFGCFL